MSNVMPGAASAAAPDHPEDIDLFDAFPPLFVPQAIADGSQVIRHDGYDVEAWDAAVRDYGKLRHTVETASQRLITALPLFRDVFWSFYKQSPTVGPIVPLTPAYAINRQMVEQILATTEWRQTRASGTPGDPIADREPADRDGLGADRPGTALPRVGGVLEEGRALAPGDLGRAGRGVGAGAIARRGAATSSERERDETSECRDGAHRTPFRNRGDHRAGTEHDVGSATGYL